MSVSRNNDEGRLASAASLLGQLQRGNGKGFLRAMREDRAVVRPLLLDCVTHDPRWDRQFESRSGYYAALLLHTAQPLDPFDSHLRANSRHNQHDVLDLVLETVCALAVRGDVSAIASVRAYLTYGPEWGLAFETLMDVPSASLSLKDMSRVIDQRFPDDDALDHELPPRHSTQQEPWRSLRLVNPRVNRILREREVKAEQQQQHEEQVYVRFASLLTSDLLAAVVDYRTEQVAARVIKNRVTAADLDLLLQVAQQGNRWQRFVALSGLQHLAHPAVLPILQAFFQSSDAQPGHLSGAARRALVALPSTLTLDLARTWFDATDGSQRHIALQILEAHATAADVPRVRNALLPSLWRDTPDTNESSMQCSMLEILTRFPDAGPFPEVETVFKEAGHARTRISAAQVLNASDGEQFARGLALECLWDCEDDVRRLGCDKVNLDVPEAHARLHVLSRDLHEDKQVRDAAKERRAALEPLREHTNRNKSEGD